MLFRKASPTLIGVAALLAAGGALAASAKSESPVVLASYYSMSDRVVDPTSEIDPRRAHQRRRPGRFPRKEERRRADRLLSRAELCAVLDHGRQADRSRAGRHRPHQGGRHRRPRPVRLSPAARPDRPRHAGHDRSAGARRGDAQPGGRRLRPRRPFRPSRPRRYQPELRLRAAHRRSGRGAEQGFAVRRRGRDAGLLQSAASRVPGAAREARRGPRDREQPAAGHSRRPPTSSSA